MTVVASRPATRAADFYRQWGIAILPTVGAVAQLGEHLLCKRE
jgi:hypothetical protein